MQHKSSTQPRTAYSYRSLQSLVPNAISLVGTSDDHHQEIMSRPSRMAVACQRCRKRKTKCDRLYPKCSTCRRLNVECFAGQHYSPDVAEDLPRGYIESLEREVRALELQATRLVAGAKEQNASLLIQTPSSYAGPSLSITSHDDQGIASTEDGSVTSRRAMPQWNLLSEAPPGASSYQRTSLFERMVYGSLTADNSDPRRSKTEGFRIGFKSTPPDLDILPRMLATEPQTFDDYIIQYMEHIHNALPFLDEDQIRSTLRLTRDGQTRNPSVEPILCMVLCIGALCAARLSHSFRHLEHARTMFLFASESLHLSVRREDLGTARLLILFMIHSLMHPNGGGTWHIRGLAVRMCITLGLHHESSLRDLAAEASIEQRRIVFWTIYAFDRWISLALGRPFGIQNVDITTELPLDGYLEPCHSSQLFYWVQKASKIKSSNKVLSEDDFSEISAAVDSAEQGRPHVLKVLLLQTLSWVVCLPHLSMDESGTSLATRLSTLYMDELSQAPADKSIHFWTWGYSAFHSCCMGLFVQNLSSTMHMKQRPTSASESIAKAISFLDTISVDFPGLRRYSEVLKAMGYNTVQEEGNHTSSNIDLGFLKGTHTYNICVAALAMQSMTSTS